MFTTRVHYDGDLLSQDTFDTLMPELEFSETLKFVGDHYPDTSGITVDLYDESGTIYASHTFA